MNQRSRQEIVISIVFGIPVLIFGLLSVIDKSNKYYLPLMLLSLGSQQLMIFLTRRITLVEEKRTSEKLFLFSSIFILAISVFLLFQVFFVH